MLAVDYVLEGVCLVLRASSGKHARLVGVCPAGGDSIPVDPVDPVDPAIVFFSPSLSCVLAHFTSPNFAPKILPFLCFTQPNIVRKPALLVFYAIRHRSKSCPSCVLGHPKKLPTKKHKKGKQKVGTKIRPKIVIFQLKILPFLCFTQIGTAHGP